MLLVLLHSPLCWKHSFYREHSSPHFFVLDLLLLHASPFSAFFSFSHFISTISIVIITIIIIIIVITVIIIIVIIYYC